MSAAAAKRVEPAETWLSPAELSARWGVPQSTLRDWRKAVPRKGPPFRQLGGPGCKVEYGLGDIEAHERAQKEGVDGSQRS